MTRTGQPQPLEQAHGRLEVATSGPGLTDITREVRDWLVEVGADDGLVTVFIRHTSASLLIQENADPDVRADLVDALARLAPEQKGYRHRTEGPDDMPAHIKTALTAVSLSVPIQRGDLLLGTWQAIYLAEHRRPRQRREALLHFVGTRRPGS